MIILLLGWLWPYLRFAPTKAWCNYGNGIIFQDAHSPHHPPKPEWVRKRVIRLKALMSRAGCRTITQVFNRMNGGA